jgi:hypothetical protein
VALNVERIVDGGMEIEETLGGSGRLEALHFPLPSSDDLMRVLSPTVCPQPLLMTRAEVEIM